MAVKFFLAFVTVLACVEFLFASPTRRHLISITESSASDSPVTNEGEVWGDNDEFDLDGQDGWYSQPAISPSSSPEKLSDYNDYEDDFNNNNNNRVKDNVIDFDDDDDEDEEDQQEAEENNVNDSEYLFPLALEDDDDEQSGPIKVRHTGRSSYPRVSEGGDNSIESAQEDNEHPYEFAIDEDDKDEDDDENDDPHKDVGVDTPPRHEAHEDDDDDEDEFVSEGEDNDMFDNPEEDAAQVIYGDHVFLY